MIFFLNLLANDHLLYQLESDNPKFHKFCRGRYILFYIMSMGSNLSFGFILPCGPLIIMYLII